MSVTITPTVRALADLYKPSMTEAASGAGKVEKETFLNNLPKDLPESVAADLPNGLTKAVLEFVDTTYVNSAAALNLAGGELGIDAFVADKSLDRVTFSMPTIGKNSINMLIDRSTETVVPSKDGVAGTKTVHGRSKVSIDMYGIGKRGQVGAVRNSLIEKATKDLGY